jgi:1-acyl-sn-glycerol-3-phosphate acyltransferase
MGKSQLFKGIGAWVFSHGGVFPVRRGQQDEEAFVTAFRILARGGAVVMYCEGGRSRTGQLAAEARPGIGRLALESGVPVVPVAILGSYQVRNWKRLQFPKVTVQFGRPFRFETVKQATREQQQEAATYILERIRELHTELSRVGRRGARRAARAGLTSLSKGEQGTEARWRGGLDGPPRRSRARGRCVMPWRSRRLGSGRAPRWPARAS